MQEGQGGGSLADADELVGALEDILGFLMRRGRHAGQTVSLSPLRGGMFDNMGGGRFPGREGQQNSLEDRKSMDFGSVDSRWKICELVLPDGRTGQVEAVTVRAGLLKTLLQQKILGRAASGFPGLVVRNA